MRWIRYNEDNKGEMFVLYVGKSPRLCILRSRDHNGAWVIAGINADDSEWHIVSEHQIISDVKRQAEGYL